MLIIEKGFFPFSLQPSFPCFKTTIFTYLSLGFTRRIFLAILAFWLPTLGVVLKTGHKSSDNNKGNKKWNII